MQISSLNLLFLTLYTLISFVQFPPLDYLIPGLNKTVQCNHDELDWNLDDISDR